MNQELARTEDSNEASGSLLLGTSLAVASMILLPALAMRMGLGAESNRGVKNCLDEGID